MTPIDKNKKPAQNPPQTKAPQETPKIPLVYREGTPEYKKMLESKPSPSIWGSSLQFETDFKIVEKEKEPIRTPQFIQLRSSWGRLKPELSEEFIEKTIQIADEVNCNPDDLMAVMHLESKMEPYAGKNFIGLGQLSSSSLKNTINYSKKKFGKDSLLNQDMTIEGFKKLSREEQLPYLRDYILMTKEGARFKPESHLSGGQLYALFFVPGSAKSNELANTKDKNVDAYKGNSHFDINKDESITVDEMQKFVDDAKALAHKFI